MTIETKHNMNDEIWFMKNNRPTSAVIREIVVEVILGASTHIMTLVFYRLIGEGGRYLESELKSSKEALLQSL